MKELTASLPAGVAGSSSVQAVAWSAGLGQGHREGQAFLYFRVSCQYGPFCKNTANCLVQGEKPQMPQPSEPFQVQLHRDFGGLSGVLCSAAWGRPGPTCGQPWAPCPQGTWVLQREPCGLSHPFQQPLFRAFTAEFLRDPVQGRGQDPWQLHRVGLESLAALTGWFTEAVYTGTLTRTGQMPRPAGHSPNE